MKAEELAVLKRIVGEKSPLHSLPGFFADKRRKLVRTPDYVNYLPRAENSTKGTGVSQVYPYLTVTGSAVPSDHQPAGTMNTLIGSGAPLNCGFSMTGEWADLHPKRPRS